MAEYIEREALIKRLEHEVDCSTSLVDVLVINGLANLVRDERIAPTVDVVEVVRCKDCEHRKEVPDCQKELYSYSCVACSYHSGLIMDGNDFCSYGVRKEGAEE